MSRLRSPHRESFDEDYRLSNKERPNSRFESPEGGKQNRRFEFPIREKWNNRHRSPERETDYSRHQSPHREKTYTHQISLEKWGLHNRFDPLNNLSGEIIT